MYNVNISSLEIFFFLPIQNFYTTKIRNVLPLKENVVL